MFNGRIDVTHLIPANLFQLLVCGGDSMIGERWGRGDKERRRGAAGKTHRWTGRGKKNEEGKQEERYKGRNSLLVTGSLVGSSSHWNRKKRESWGCSTLQPSQTHRGGERKRETHQHMSDHSTLSSCRLSYCPLGGRALYNPTLLVFIFIEMKFTIKKLDWNAGQSN